MSVKISERELYQLVKTLDLGGDTPEALTSEPDLDELSVNGGIRVTNNSIMVEDPSGGGLAAAIVPKPPLVVHVNGQRIDTETKVRSTDKIEWKVTLPPLFQIVVAEDKMSATFRLSAKERCAWRLQDAEKVNVLELTAVEETEIVLERLNLPDIMKVIKDKNIVKNLNVALIYQELQYPTGKSIVIAVGKPSKPGIDARLDQYFSNSLENVFEEVAGNVDFRNHLKIPSANKGDVICRKSPAIEGEPGYDVCGNVLQPRPPKDLIVVAKENILMQEDGSYIAGRDGRPRITGTTVKFIEITTSFVVPGDVDIRTGNIVFSGDVVVCGDVTENMVVESLGNVYVMGNVYGGTITATGSVCVKGNIVRGHLYSGYFGVIHNRLYKSSEQLHQLLEGLIVAARTLISMIEAKRQTVHLGQVLLVLMESKFKEIPLLAKDIMQVLSSVRHLERDTLVEFKEKLEQMLRPILLHSLESIESLVSLKNMVKEVHDGIARMQESSVSIDITRCHLSLLMSNGDVAIRKEGVLQSRIIANGNIVFYEENSVCKSSELEAEGSISAMHVGGQTCSGTRLKAKNRVIVKSMCAGRVCIGKYCRDVFEPIEETVFDLERMKISG